MFTGTMIEDLIKTVEKTEQQARSLSKPVVPIAKLAVVYPAFSPAVWQWTGVEQAVIGVA
jgi:hypothetical protein